jgi:hypothetical protein
LNPVNVNSSIVSKALAQATRRNFLHPGNRIRSPAAGILERAWVSRLFQQFKLGLPNIKRPHNGIDGSDQR